MDYKKYKACLMGLIVFALVCGAFLYMRNMKNSQIPADGMLVDAFEMCGNERDA